MSDRPDDVAAIEAIGARWHDAELAGDWDALVALCAEDVAMLPPNQPPILGRTGVREFFAPLTILQHTLRWSAIEASGDLAYARGAYDISLTVPGMDQAIEDTGTVLWVLRRGPGQEWLIAATMFSSDSPPTG